MPRPWTSISANACYLLVLEFQAIVKTLPVPLDLPGFAMSDSFDVQAQIAQLWIYPIKSCAGVALDEAVLTDTGLDLDRAWMVVDELGEFVTQREYPRMALVRPQLKQLEMVLRAPGMLALHVSVDAVESACRAKVWDDVVAAYDMGDIAAQWFTDFLGADDKTEDRKKFRLVRFDPEHQRLSDMKWTNGVRAYSQFSDGFAVLVMTESSLPLLQAKLAENGFNNIPNVTLERFRPNIVLKDLDAHDEDHIDSINIDGVVLKLVKPCARCPIPAVDPATAQVSPEISAALGTYRANASRNGAITVGMNAIITNGIGQTLRVGQVVQGTYKF
jgi:uncharacterized protein YcbX